MSAKSAITAAREGVEVVDVAQLVLVLRRTARYHCGADRRSLA
ncbi:MAG: hypothetical protein ABIM89_15175 [Mycobacteriales bacterium]